jgi:hypothetical protein
MLAVVDLAQTPVKTLVGGAQRRGNLAPHRVLVNAYLRGEHLQAAQRPIKLPREIREDFFSHPCFLRCVAVRSNPPVRLTRSSRFGRKG